MPQLAPINWMFLFLLFWLIIAIISSLQWWSYSNNYDFSYSNTLRKIQRYLLMKKNLKSLFKFKSISKSLK